MVLGSSPVAVTSPSDFTLASSKEFLDIQATIECGFILKCVRDMIRRYSRMHRTDKYSERSSVIWSVRPNDWVFVYGLSGSGFESICSHKNEIICLTTSFTIPLWKTGFDLTTRDSYFMILVEVFTNHILAEKKNFKNHLEWTE